ncbi:MAG: uracil-DNA glycosylase [Dehalococcoidales bacterium]|nr:MAG: uracil-DNA glycosylase [Dehalococcoidales bacterium]
MKTSDKIICPDFPCSDVNTASYVVPDREIQPDKIRILMIAEAPPVDKEDYIYAEGNPFHLQTTVQAFNDAGVNISTVQEILDLGVYITTAIKCGKTQYSVSGQTIKNCSGLLEKEVALFSGIEVFMLMGDVAIKAMNSIWKKKQGTSVIPGGSTYKIRNQKYYYEDKRVFPSYLQTGKNYLIEKSKRTMIAEDIKEAIKLIKGR